MFSSQNGSMLGRERAPAHTAGYFTLLLFPFICPFAINIITINGDFMFLIAPIMARIGAMAFHHGFLISRHFI
jgi:hypothetical protein